MSLLPDAKDRIIHIFDLNNKRVHSTGLTTEGLMYHKRNVLFWLGQKSHRSLVKVRLRIQTQEANLRGLKVIEFRIGSKSQLSLDIYVQKSPTHSVSVAQRHSRRILIPDIFSLQPER